jgi:flagellar M-ring protein FliF
MAEETMNTKLEALSSWPTLRKLSLAGLVLLIIALCAIIIIQFRAADSRLLFTNLSSDDTAIVVAWLKEHDIPYRLGSDGKSIRVPSGQVYESRLALADEGLPRGGGVGFEVFDRQDPELSNFAQMVNYRRALQGELSRTIATLAPIESARVHLAIPEQGLVQSGQQMATASVVLQLHNGRKLSSSQVEGIIHLVASSVEGLESDKVTVVDSLGKIIASEASAADVVSLAPDMLKHQLSVEAELERRTQSLLDRALGVGNSMVQITAKIDYRKREVLEEIYEPGRTAIVSEQSSEEIPASANSDSRHNPNGLVTTPRADSPSTRRTEEKINYEVSKVINKLVEPVGALENLSVAVLVADKLTTSPASGETSTMPRDKQELQNIERMVRSALGLNVSRGDQISVISMPFVQEPSAEPLPSSLLLDSLGHYIPIFRYLFLAIGILLVYRLIVKPLIVSVSGGQMIHPLKTVEELENEMNDLTGNESSCDPVEQFSKQLLNAQSSPSQVVKAWLQEN